MSEKHARPGPLCGFPHWAASYRQREGGDAERFLSELEKKTGLRGAQLYAPLGVVLTGQRSGPDLKDILRLVGKERILRRLEKALSAVSDKD